METAGIGGMTPVTHTAKRKRGDARTWPIVSVAIGMMLCGCATTPESVTVKSGEKALIGMAMATDENCTSATASFIYPETPGYPAHGQVSYQLANGHFKKNTTHLCAGKTTRGVAVIYRSDPGFVGTDRVTVRTFDRSEHVINITVVEKSSRLPIDSKLRGP